MSGPDLFRVEIGPEALADMDAIAAYLSEHADGATARDFFDAVSERIASPERFPFRGPEPKEFGSGNPGGYRQILLGRNRIFYRIRGSTVTIAMVVDNRRDVAALLRERLSPDPPT